MPTTRRNRWRQASTQYPVTPERQPQSSHRHDKLLRRGKPKTRTCRAFQGRMDLHPGPNRIQHFRPLHHGLLREAETGKRSLRSPYERILTDRTRGALLFYIHTVLFSTCDSLVPTKRLVLYLFLRCLGDSNSLLDMFRVGLKFFS